MLVGLTGGSLCEIEVDLRDVRTVKDLPEARRRIAGGHGRGVRGLAAHPDSGVCATCGEDGVLMCWDVENKRQMWQVRLLLAAKTPRRTSLRPAHVVTALRWAYLLRCILLFADDLAPATWHGRRTPQSQVGC